MSVTIEDLKVSALVKLDVDGEKHEFTLSFDGQGDIPIIEGPPEFYKLMEFRGWSATNIMLAAGHVAHGNPLKLPLKIDMTKKMGGYDAG